MHPDENDLRALYDPLRRRQSLLSAGIQLLAVKTATGLCFLLYTQLKPSALHQTLRGVGRSIASTIGMREPDALRKAGNATVALAYALLVVVLYVLLTRAIRPWYRGWCARNGLCECGRGRRESIVVSAWCDRCSRPWPTNT